MRPGRSRHLIEAQIPALRRFAFALTREREAADDLVQDCLARALSRWHLLRAEADLRAWLFSVLRNLFLDDRRRAARRPVSVGVEDWQMAGPEGAAESALQLGAVLAAIGRLPQDQREVLLLVGVEDFTYAEAARVLGVPEGTVMSRLSRGRRALRALVEAPGTAPPGAGGAGLRRVK